MNLTRSIRDKMTKERLMFVYRGVVTSENSASLLMLLEKEMENSEFGFVGRKRVFMFILESLQNISRHGDRSAMSNMSLVVFSKANGGYTITTGNVIFTSGIEGLKKRLDEINHLQTGEIRAVYRQMLSNSEFSSKGGAGLGLIEMAKKTGNKLDYDFHELDKENSYFILSKTVDEEGIGVHYGENKKPFNGKAVNKLERMMAEKNIYLIWSGHITPDVGKEVISFTETKLAEEEIESSLRRKVFSILVEIIENVAKFTPGREIERKFGMPVAMIRYEDKRYTLSTGNLILNENVPRLKGKLDTINSYDRAGLTEFFRNSLSGQNRGSESTGNMGLIDMARKSGNRLVYEFDRVNDTWSYYILNVMVEEEDG